MFRVAYTRVPSTYLWIGLFIRDNEDFVFQRDKIPGHKSTHKCNFCEQKMQTYCLDNINNHISIQSSMYSPKMIFN